MKPVRLRQDEIRSLHPSIEAGQLQLYKMHGTVAHPTDVVIATDDYELYRRQRAGFLQVLNGHLVGLNCLFLGFGFTDPNIGHLLGLIRESMGDHATTHYAIVRKPQADNPGVDKRVLEYQIARHAHWVEDMKRYGINCVEVDAYEEIDSLLLELEARVARRSVFVSGSYPESGDDSGRARVAAVADQVGQLLGSKNLRLVSGFGLTVGGAVMSGMLSKLYESDVPSLDRSLMVRPFPRETPKGFAPDEFKRRYREDLVRQAGVCIFIGGVRKSGDRPENAYGVWEEFEIARNTGRILVPIAASGGVAEQIWKEINEQGGATVARLSEGMFARLGEPGLTVEEIAVVVAQAIEEVLK